MLYVAPNCVCFQLSCSDESKCLLLLLSLLFGIGVCESSFERYHSVETRRPQNAHHITFGGEEISQLILTTRRCKRIYKIHQGPPPPHTTTCTHRASRVPTKISWLRFVNVFKLETDLLLFDIVFIANWVNLSHQWWRNWHRSMCLWLTVWMPAPLDVPMFLQ